MLALPLIIITMVVAGSIIFLYENRKTQGSDLDRRSRSALSGPLLIAASVIAASIFTIAYAYRFGSVVRLPSAACWVGPLTGGLIAAPSCLKEPRKAAISPGNRTRSLL